MAKKKVQIQDIAHDEEYLSLVQYVGRTLAANPLDYLVTTDITKEQIVDAYLSGLPENVRQYYTCSACFSWLDHFGTLGYIDAGGRLRPAVWKFNVEGWFGKSVENMASLFARANVTGVFLTDRNCLGIPQTGKWHHFHLEVPPRMVARNALLTSGQQMAQKREEFLMLKNYVGHYTVKTIETAVAICQSDTVYRSEKVLGVAEWFLELKKDVMRLTRQSKKYADNIIWRAVALAPAGWAHIGNTMIGTMLDDIMEGYSVRDVSARFAQKMAPSQYQRAQVAPSAGNVQRAEKIITAMKAAGSLDRRHATLEEVPLLWRPRTARGKSGGVFGAVTVKRNRPSADVEIPEKVVTWEKFRTLLDGITGMEVMVPSDTNRAAALVTAVDPDAPHLFQWGNPFSWHYEDGIDAEVKRRVVSAGGRVEDVDIRVSLAWNNRNDLDLHCITPRGHHIYYGAKHDGTGGYLDVDMNVRGETTKPVENIRWPRNEVRPGVYQFYVENYRFHDSSFKVTPYWATVEVFGKTFSFSGVLPDAVNHAKSRQVIITFEIPPNGGMVIVRQSLNSTRNEPARVEWLETGHYQTCCGIADSPNTWDGQITNHGEHVFFFLEGCTPPEDPGLNFYPEMLKSEYREIRATLEAWNAATRLHSNPGDQLAAGLGFVKGQPWNLRVRVFKGDVAFNYIIDRWE